MFDVNNEDAIIEMPNKPTKFKITSVRPFEVIQSISFDDESKINKNDAINDDQPPQIIFSSFFQPMTTQLNLSFEMSSPAEKKSIDLPDVHDFDEISEKRNDQSHQIFSNDPVKPIISAPVKRDRDRPRKYSVKANLISSNICFVINGFDNSHLKSFQFTASRHKEIFGLIEKDVFQLVNSEEISSDARIFNSRFVEKVKHFDTETIYKKSRLMVQAYNDSGKDLVLI